jgi:hypothetical protein
VLGVGLTTLPCKKKIVEKPLRKFSRILRMRPRPKLGCGAKERKKDSFDGGSAHRKVSTYTGKYENNEHTSML